MPHPAAVPATAAMTNLATKGIIHFAANYIAMDAGDGERALPLHLSGSFHYTTIWVTGDSLT